MKKLLFSLTALVCSTGLLFAQDAKPAGKKVADVAKFDSETIDLGKIKQDNPTTAVFTVTNISKEPLIIEQANPTCGCTIGDYTKEPIAPGKTGTIKATYNAKNLNAFDKHLTVKFAGVDEIKSITIKGEVLTADDYAKLHGGAADTKAAATTTTTEVKTTAAPAKAPAKTATKKAAPAPKS
ncbi:MAG: DUF1573 domain-containing protein [Bacteroidetes bacterium]|nr:DUF1573 domain-containing protein [Bacteroidota bacterium]